MAKFNASICLLSLTFAATFSLTNVAVAKLPPLSEEQKAKAAEAKAKADEAAKKGAQELAKAQDQVAARYIKEQKAKGKTVTPTPIAPPAAPAATGAAPAAAQTPPNVKAAAQPPKK
jgi:peptidoglycan hydrolase CwlO-like protein